MRCSGSAGTTGDALEGAVRLAGGTSVRGRVEIYHAGQWGTVCDDAWGLDDARVACRALGFADAREAIQNFGGGSDPIWCVGWMRAARVRLAGVCG